MRFAERVSCRPRQLEITAADKLVATENLDVLKQNGFELDPGEENDSGEKREVKLVAQPFSKSTVFDMKGSVFVHWHLSSGPR